MKRVPAGFTLIEILVVVVIVAIISGIAIANLPRFARTGDLESESRRIAAVIDLVRQEAILQSMEYGLAPTQGGYQFLMFDDAKQQWSIQKTAPLQPRTLATGISLSIQVEDSEVKLNLSSDEAESPPILLLSSGETTPFKLTLTLTSEGLSRTLVGDGFNDPEWQGDEAK
jgi:general secretion pathway protein H